MSHATNDEFFVDNFTVGNAYELSDFYNIVNNFQSNTLKILHLNINGCRTNFNELNLFLASLPYQYAIIALTETRLTANTDFGFHLLGYKCITHYSNHGLKIYYLNSLKLNSVTDLYFNDNYKETIFVKIKCSTLGELMFGVIYRPHSCSIQEFTASFKTDILDKISPRMQLILTGDFNINLAHSHAANVEDFIYTMNESNLIPSIDKFTRYNANNPTGSSIIDHFWSRIPFQYFTNIIKTNISDHYIVTLH